MTNLTTVDPKDRPRYDLRSLFSNPAFWSGAFETRKQMMHAARDDYERSIHAAAQARIETIADSLSQGLSLVDIPDFTSWLAGGKL
jgi:hypothetical protein